jgi:signal transduction histidine kinase
MNENQSIKLNERLAEQSTAMLILANEKLAIQNQEIEKRAAELIIANKELAFQNEEKEKRAAELIVANAALVFQNEEREKRAAEFIVANKELAFQNQEKEKRAAELLLQNEEEGKRAAELIIANKELAFQNGEKEKRAAELIIANAELSFQNQEKEKRALELLTANAELRKAEDNIRKLNEADIRKLNDALEKKVIERTIELEAANHELEAFSYSVSHDLRAPLRIVSGYAIILQEEYHNIFDEEGNRLLSIVQDSAKKMGILIDDLLAFSRLGKNQVVMTNVDMNSVVNLAVAELTSQLNSTLKIEISPLLNAYSDYSLISQVWKNLISNAIKYSAYIPHPIVAISCLQTDTDTIFSISDNGVGFDMKYAHKLFGVFQRLHDVDEFEGTGVGLALVQRIIKKHGGRVWAESEIGKGATFSFSLPLRDTA